MAAAELEVMIEVLTHWYKHTMAEVSGAPVRTTDGTLEEYGDPKLCKLCTALTLGMAHPNPVELILFAEGTFEQLREVARRRGLM